MKPVAVILGVGASNGLGAALARRFARGDMEVVVSGRSSEKLELIVDEVSAVGGKIVPCTADATKAEDMDALFDFSARQGDIGAVVYNVGNNAIIPFDELSAEQFETFWRVCCFGGFHTAKAALPHLKKGDGGSLLFTGASASIRGRRNFAHFASAKAALRNLAQALAREYGPEGVHVGHVVIDGVINGEMAGSRFKEYLDALGENGSLEPDDIAEAYWQLHCQPKSAWTHEIDIRPYKEQW